jgi:hypothetical protein
VVGRYELTKAEKAALNTLRQKWLLSGRGNGQQEPVFGWTAGAVWWPKNISGPYICFSFIILFNDFSVCPVE